MLTKSFYYVDDDPDDLEMFEHVFNQFKNQSKLHLFDSSTAFLNLLTHNNINNTIVLLDINIPYKNGFDVLKEIREKPNASKAIVIMFSTSDNPSSVEKSKQLGANLYVVKPSGMSDLKKFVQLLVNQINIGEFPSKYVLNYNYN